MKTLLLLMLSLIPALAFPQAQDQKIGHANWQYILSQLPEYRQVETELKSLEGQFQNQLVQKSNDFEKKLKMYQSLPAGTPEAVRRDKESELVYLRDNLQQFRQDVQASMQRKQDELLMPLIDKIGAAIKAVATSNGFAYILNPEVADGNDVFLYGDDRYDISNLVLIQLGVAPKKE